MTEKPTDAPAPKLKVKTKGKRKPSSGREKSAKRSGRSGGGRPAFRPSIEQRTTVEEMRYCGESEAVIARAIGIDVDTLKKHFEDELADGHAQRRKEVIGLLFRDARSGNVSAIRRLEEIGRAPRAVDKPDEPAQPKLGKKAEQQQAAERIAGKFAVPQPPRLVVDNR